MKYARIENNIIVEFFETDGDISKMFHPSLIWIPCSSETVGLQWRYVDGDFRPPLEVQPQPPQPAQPMPRYVDANSVSIGQAERLYDASKAGQTSATVLIELLDL